MDMPSKRLALVVILFFLYASASTKAESPMFSTPYLASLIGPKTIIAIHKDSSDALWIGTESGLFRYDGAKIIHFNTNRDKTNHIPISHIAHIGERLDGIVLIATYGAGLLEWDPASNRFVGSKKLGVSKNTELFLKDLHVSKSGHIFVLSETHVFLHDPITEKDKAFDFVLRNSALLQSPISIAETHTGDILISTKTGVVKVDTRDSSIRLLPIKNSSGQRSSFVTTIYPTRDDYVYLGTSKGELIALDTLKYKEVSRVSLPHRASSLVSEITMINDQLIVATDNGVFSADNGLKSARNISSQGHGLTHSDVVSMHRDRDSIWIGTYRGLELLKFSNLYLFITSTSNIPRGVSGFSENSNGDIWIATYSGLYAFNKDTGFHNRFGELFSTPLLADQRISSLNFNNDQLWISFYSGGLQIVEMNELPKPESANLLFQDRFFTKILHDEKKGTTWLSSWDTGIAKVDSSFPGVENSSWYLSNQRVLSSLITRDGKVLISSENTIYQYSYRTDQFKPIGVIEPPSEYVAIEINSISEGKDSTIWLGTRDYGIYALPSDSSRWPITAQSLNDVNLSSSTVHAIEVDDHGNLWCSTNKGIVKLSPEGKFIARFTKEDGLQGNDFELGASFKNSEGELFFGGPYGYNRFHPDDIEIDRTVPEVRLTDVEFPDEERIVIWDHRSTEEVVLTHKDRSVIFRFSIPDYTSPNQNQFRYILEGFDERWVESGAVSFAKYTNLPSGEYTFRVQAANSAGMWNTDGLSISIVKYPAPWLAWWAFLIYAAAFLLLWWASNKVYQSYTFRRRTRELQHEKLEIEIRSNEELQEQMEIQNLLVRSAYQHSLSTLSVLDTVLKSCTTEQPQALGNHSLKWLRVLRTLENCLYYFADNPTANLNEFTNEAIVQLLQHSPVPTDTLVTINDVTSKYVPTEAASPLSIIIYELLENSIQHAFLPDSAANYVQVRLAQKSEPDMGGYFWELEVIDSGIGFDASEQTMGTGLTVVRTLVESLGGELELDTDSGTRTRIKVPAIHEGNEVDKLALSA